MTNILLGGIVGSTAYGLAGPDSDVDRLGVYAADTVEFHGLIPPIEKRATIVTVAPDSTLHEALKFVQLCSRSNPTVTELLWLPRDLYETVTEHGQRLLDIRTAFSTAHGIKAAYLGYATQQLRLLVNTGQFQSKMRARQEKHGRHLLRLLDQGYHFYTTGTLDVRVEDPQRYRDFGERVGQDPEYARVALSDAEEKFARARTSPLPDHPDLAKIEQWLHDVRRAFL